MEFKERLKSCRKEKDLTQKQIAEKLKVVESCYANWEQGRSEPSIESLKELSKIFDVSIDYLVGNEKVPDENARDLKLKMLFSTIGITENKLQNLSSLDFQKLNAYVQGLIDSKKN